MISLNTPVGTILRCKSGTWGSKPNGRIVNFFAGEEALLGGWRNFSSVHNPRIFMVGGAWFLPSRDEWEVVENVVQS